MSDLIAIETPPGFAFNATVVSHGWYLLAPFHWDRSSQTLHRSEEIDGTAIDLTIRWRKRHLLIESEPDLNRFEQALRPRIDRMFQLQVDTREFLRICRATPSHALAARLRLGRLLCGSTLFEDAVKVITTTNTTWRQTMRMVQLLVEHYGRPTAGGRPAFPTAEAIARERPERLRERCKLGYRSGTIHALARGIVEGSRDLARITDPRQSTPEMFKNFLSLPGIGPYGAAHLLAMEGRYDFIAVDTEFRRFVRERYHRGRAISDRTLVKRYARWGKWQYLAYWSELWISIQGQLQEFEKGNE